MDDAGNTFRKLSEFKNSPTMEVFRKKCDLRLGLSHPTKSEWKRLIHDFSRFMPLTYSALGGNDILSLYELRVCVLLLAGFNTAEIIILLATSPQSLTNLKSKANNKLFGENSASTLERNLMNSVGLA